MTPERWRQIEEVFQAAAECATERRATFLDQACAGDDALRAEVESLLAHEAKATFIEAAIKEAAESLPPEAAESVIGRRIGAYRVSGLVGHGGMGAVYAAVRDDDQYRKQVALKLVKRGMDTDFVLSRFRHERQILAGLEHAHIARLLDGGTTEDGLPYFVMEYVEGQAITHYCETKRLSVPERLRLFRLVCSAVQYAHQNLVVHRDLKPSNILVSVEGAPKLLDFGIAKLLHPELSPEAPTQTATGMRLMTPDYASPEQVRGLPITTASDIYSLGVVLYELLTGERPYQFKNYSPPEIERVICQTETERPSVAVGRGKDAPAKLRKQLAGDLDNIVLMAMRKEPERRYQSVEQFSEDIRRHLEGRPVMARQDTLGYRAGKFVRRNKLSLAAAALVILSLVGGIVATTYQARRAERRFQQVRKLANTFLFDFHDKIELLPGSTEAREMVVKTALEYLDSLAREAAGDPALELEWAVAYRKVADVQGYPYAPSLGHTEAAVQSYQKSVSLAQKLVAQDAANPAVRRALAAGDYKLGVMKAESGDKPAGVVAMRAALQVAEPLAQQTGDPLDMALVENCYVRIGYVLLETGNAAGALQSFRRSQELTERRAAAHPSDRAQFAVATCRMDIGQVLGDTGDPAGALENYQQAQRTFAALVAKEPMQPNYRRNLHVAYERLGNYSGHPRSINLGDRQAALKYFQQAFALEEELVAADPKNAQARLGLADSYERLAGLLAESDPAQSAQLYRQALALTRALLEAAPNEFRYLTRHANYLSSLAAPLRRLGDRQGALEQVRQSLEILQPLAAKDPTDGELQNDLHAAFTALADTLLNAGDRAGALEHYRQALTLAETSAAAKPADLYAQWRLADSYASLGQYHATLAAAPKAPLTERIASWREARAWRQKSLAVWDGWGQHAVSSVFNTTRREQAARALAQCEAALTKLGTTPER